MSESTERFDPVEKMIKIGRADYLLVRDRMMWAREQHPNLCIATEVLRLDDTIAVFKARVDYVADDGGIVFGEGHGSETPKDFPEYIEKAETKAVGRALGALGYGTAAAFEENPDISIADAPVARSSAPRTYTKPPVRSNPVVNGNPVGRQGNGAEDDAPVMANAGQVMGIERLWKDLERTTDDGEPEELSTVLFGLFAQEAPEALTQYQAGEMIASLSKEWEAKRSKMRAPARAG
jgi:hypothetical protein